MRPNTDALAPASALHQWRCPNDPYPDREGVARLVLFASGLGGAGVSADHSCLDIPDARGLFPDHSVAAGTRAKRSGAYRNRRRTDVRYRIDRAADVGAALDHAADRG